MPPCSLTATRQAPGRFTACMPAPFDFSDFRCTHACMHPDCFAACMHARFDPCTALLSVPVSIMDTSLPDPSSLKRHLPNAHPYPVPCERHPCTQPNAPPFPPCNLPSSNTPSPYAELLRKLVTDQQDRLAARHPYNQLNQQLGAPPCRHLDGAAQRSSM